MAQSARAFFIRCKRFAARWDGPLALISITAVVIVWIYSNFATASALTEAKTEVTRYVDVRHGEVKGDLEEIKAELAKQRALQEQILLRVQH